MLAVSDDGDPPADPALHQDLTGVVRDRVEAVGATMDVGPGRTGLPEVTVTIDRTPQGGRP